MSPTSPAWSHAARTARRAGDEYDQAKDIFVKIRGLIEAAGGTMADVVKVVIFVTDIKNREKVWRARREVFTGDFPVSTLVQVAALASPDIKVEIEAIAHLGAGALSRHPGIRASEYPGPRSFGRSGERGPGSRSALRAPAGMTVW